MRSELFSAVEMPVELLVNNKVIATFMCTPSDLEELAIGHLLTRGMLTDLSLINDIKIDLNTYRIFVSMNTNTFNQLYSIPEFVVSGTSSVDKFSDNIYKIPKIKNEFSINISQITDIAHRLDNEAVIYNTTGGVHSSIVSNPDKDIYFLREDIGRHCSVDKAIGAAVKEGVDLSSSFIATTGRLSLDMLLKCAAVQIPVVTSFKYPSDMGIKLAEYYNITIVSRILSENPLIYTNKQRIVE